MAVSGFCPNCGAPRGEGAFCANCGANLADPSATGATSKPASQPSEGVVPRLRTSVPDFIRNQLHPDEQLLASYSASLFDHRRKGEWRHDKFALTNERIIYFHTGVIHKGMGEMPYRGITGVSFNKGFRHGKVIVEAANAGLTIDGIGNDDAAFAEKIIAASVAGRRLRAVGVD